MAARLNWRVRGRSEEEKDLSLGWDLPGPLLYSAEPDGESLAASHLQTRQ